MLIDFHTHTRASDGALTPQQLLGRAVDAGVSMLAITDHDTVNGYLEVRDHDLTASGLQLVAGVELSCRWQGVTIHVVGLGVDCEHAQMRHAMAVMDAARTERGALIAQRLAKCGFEGALEGALQEADGSQLGRPHFAAWMVEQGHVVDHNTAFDRYLGQGKTGDVKTCWPDLAEVVGWIEDSGGASVLAHPYKYKFTGMKLRRLVMAFVAAGGSAIEIRSGRQTPEQMTQLRRLAREYDLEVSIGSDFHRDGPYAAPLGVETPRHEGLRGVWQRWQSAPDEGASS
ncbi:MAG: PHP domain-containing protein [Gammaproteobacteria bacterium]|nr:PHP domain-containing protein [Gammaproteobacteria bacterium]